MPGNSKNKDPVEEARGPDAPVPLGSEGYHLLSSVPIPEQFQHTICHPLPGQESPWANPVQAASLKEG